MTIVLYYFEASPPVRSVLMTINILGINVQLIRVNLSKEEQLQEEFLKVNPTHTVPTLDDNGFIVWDSHAIIQYLADKYSKDDHFYPINLEKRTLVNQMLFFDTSIIFPSLALAVRPVYYDGATSVPKEKLDVIDSSLGFLEVLLKDKEFVTGSHLTIADICLLATVSTINIFYPLQVEKYPKTKNWFDSLKKSSFYQANLDGIQKFTDMFLPLLKE
ncbi:hypothetical protein ABEB36_007497 [Hypothenemus hampei]|uniref:Glutathione transferase n=1 Tax=Hypothenemus hampei TaxID=57062 RepID=A0ABD1EUR5_HYPHA